MSFDCILNRELFKQRLEVINEQYVGLLSSCNEQKRLLKGCDVQETVQLIDIEESRLSFDLLMNRRGKERGY